MGAAEMTAMLTVAKHQGSYLRVVDTSLLERTIVGVLGAHVAVLAPVAWEGAIHTGKAAETD